VKGIDIILYFYVDSQENNLVIDARIIL
jgi:hypothetical protein